MNKKEIRWKDVFNCQKVFPKYFAECQDIAVSVGYSYILFNGLVYSVDARGGEDWLCKDSDLVI